MRALTIRDGCFFGKPSASYGGDMAEVKPTGLRWERVDAPPADVYTDICIPEAPAGGNAVAWLIEPPSMLGKDGHYRWVEENRDAFRFALTYRADLLADRFYRFYPHGGAWVWPEPIAPSKSKLVSLMGSEKRLSEGHKLRANVADACPVDVYGRGYRPIASKVTALLPYAFQVVIENWRADFYFTEKLIDCFLTRTIPIYWGCPGIGRFFDNRGILAWDHPSQLNGILNDLSFKQYAKLVKYADANYHEALQYACSEDWIARAYPDLIEGATCAS